MALRDNAIWWSGLVTLPILVRQAFQARQRTPMLSSAPSPHSGTCTPEAASESRALSVYLVGESTVAGVGARDHEHGLSGQLALWLSEELGRPVRWEALGLIGARAQECLEHRVELEMVPRMHDVAPDLIVVVLGVNDTTKLTSRRRWRRALGEIVKRCRQVTDCPIVLTGVPPMEQFAASAWPLRAVLGARARLLDRDSRRVAAESSDCWHFSTAVELARDDLASDGFHPSESGYARWGRELGVQVASMLTV